MRFFLANLGVNLVALACVGFAGYLLITDKGGNAWGWFLFVGVLCAGSASLKNTKD